MDGRLARVFGGVDFPVIAMAHLPALPGAPLHDGESGMAGVVDAVASDVEILLDEGVDAVMFCNENDRPYRLQATLADAAAMARVVAQLAPADRPFGVDYLWDAECALAVAVATGASFIREVMPGVYESDMGLWRPDPAALLRERRALGADALAVLMNVTPEFASPLGTRPAGVRARSAVVSTLADAILVSGPMAGSEPDVEAVREVVEAVAGSAPVLLNTGAKASNLADYRPLVDGVIVGSDLKVDGGTWNPVDRERVRRFLAAAGTEAAVLLGLDVGTTALKAVLLDPARGIVGRASRPLENTSPAPSWSEADPAAWLQAALAIVPEACADSGVDPRAVEAVGVAGCVPCVVLLDADDAPLRPALLYNDGRADREIAEVRDAIGADAVLARTGAGVTQQSVGPKLRWLARHEPDAAGRARRVAGSYDWLAGRLAGVAFSERNWALESGLYDLDREDFAEDLLVAADWDRARLAPIRDPADVVGGITAEVAAATGLRAGAPVVAGLADHVASAFGAGLASPGDVLVKLGGSVDVLAVSDRPLVDERLYLDAHPAPGLWLPNGCMASGGSAIRWFQRELAGGTPLAELDREAAATEAGADGLVILPYLLGEKTPLNDPLASGAIVGLGLGHTRGHLFRALLESFGHGVRHHLEVLAEHGIRPTRARVANGGASSALWKQAVGDVTGLELEPLADHPGSALGAAFAAGVGTGAFAAWSDIERFLEVGSVVVPDPSVRAVHDARHAVYRALYEPLVPSFRALRGVE